jgi:excisionase family DNA binding protein
MHSAKERVEELLKPEVATQLKISVATLDRWIAAGRAPASYKIGRERRFTQESVDRFVAEQQAAAR